MNDENLNPPVNVGEDYHLPIEGFGNKGDPFGKINNYIIFINLPTRESAVVGKRYHIRISKVTPKQAFSEPIPE